MLESLLFPEQAPARGATPMLCCRAKTKSGASMNDIKLLVGGADTAAKGGATFERKSPITGEVVSRSAAASADDARAACDAAAKAFPAWAALGPNARRKLLME